MIFVNCDIALLRTHDWFDELSDAELNLLAKQSRHISFQENEILLTEGKKADYCLLIHQGLIEGLRYTFDGDEKILGQATDNAMVSVLSVFLDKPFHMYNVKSLSAGTGFLLNSDILKQLCTQNAAFTGRILKHGAELARHNVNQIDWLTSSTAEERLAEYIVRFGIRDNVTGLVSLPLTYNQIAIKLGMRPETLSRILMKWRKDELIADKKNKLHILNMDYFTAQAEMKERKYSS